jgi:hypothetical protein
MRWVPRAAGVPLGRSADAAAPLVPAVVVVDHDGLVKTRA